MSGQLFRDVYDVSYAPFGAIAHVVAAGVSEGGTKKEFTGDEATVRQWVDEVDVKSVVSIYTNDLPALLGMVQGSKGNLTFYVKSGDGGAGQLAKLSAANFMAGDSRPRHGDVDCAGVLNFRGQSADGYTSPFSIVDVSS